MEQAISEVKLSTGKTVKIYQDGDCESPRAWDNLSQMICFHGKYSLGDDDHDYNNDDYNNWDEMRDAIEATERPIVLLPLYLYDHSGITMSTEPFGCRWDSGQVGFIFINHAKLDAYGLTVKDEETWENFLERLTLSIKEDVKIYDQYISGEVYSFVIEDNNGDVIDSCGGFYGDSLEGSGMNEHMIENLTTPEIVEFKSESSFV